MKDIIGHKCFSIFRVSLSHDWYSSQLPCVHYCEYLFVLLLNVCSYSVSLGGSVTYSKVRTFLKKQHMVTNMYKQIITLNNTISLSENHLIYTRSNWMEKFNPM